MKVEREKFEEMVRNAVEELPRQFRNNLDNVAFVVEPRPTPEQLRENNIPPGGTLLGLYEGVPQTKRDRYSMVTPDQITIFQEPIQNRSRSMNELREHIRDTVYHEIAHHFGMDEDRVRRAEEDRHTPPEEE